MQPLENRDKKHCHRQHSSPDTLYSAAVRIFPSGHFRRDAGYCHHIRRFHCLEIRTEAGNNLWLCCRDCDRNLSGNIGIETLSKTIEGFIAGYFHIPEDSHASTLQKKQMFYKGVFLASLTGRILYTLTFNVLSLPTAWHIAYSIGLATLLTMILAVLSYQLF